MTVARQHRLSAADQEGAGKPERRPGRRDGAAASAWATCWTAGPASSPAASSSGWRWPGRWSAIRRCSCSTSRCPTWTRGCGWRPAPSSSGSSANSASPPSSSPTTRPRRWRWPIGWPSWTPGRIRQLGTPREVFQPARQHLRRQLHRLDPDEPADATVDRRHPAGRGRHRCRCPPRHAARQRRRDDSSSASGPSTCGCAPSPTRRGSPGWSRSSRTSASASLVTARSADGASIVRSPCPRESEPRDRLTRAGRSPRPDACCSTGTTTASSSAASGQWTTPALADRR